MTDFDIHPEGEGYKPMALDGVRDSRTSRNPQEDLHTAINLAYTFAGQLKALHPLAEKQIKGMIFQGNLL